MLTYIPAKNIGYIIVSFQAVIGSHFEAYIQYVGYGFTAFLTHEAYGVLIY